MTVEAKDLKEVPDEKLQEDIDELNKKADKTPEEVEVLKTFKEERKTRYQKRINTMTREKKEAEEDADRLRKENAELKARIESSAPKETPSIKELFVEIDGKKYHTDASLEAQVKSGEITDAEAYAHQALRVKAQIKSEIREEMQQEEERKGAADIRKRDVEKVRKDYPTFVKKLEDGSPNPDFDPEDPVYKKAQELFAEVYHMRPDGLSKAIERAKEILKSGVQPDRSDDLGLEGSHTTTPAGGERVKEVTLSEAEKESAVKQWCRGDYINPKTGKAYTETEACAKALQAKKNRQAK